MRPRPLWIAAFIAICLLLGVGLAAFIGSGQKAPPAPAVSNAESPAEAPAAEVTQEPDTAAQSASQPVRLDGDDGPNTLSSAGDKATLTGRGGNDRYFIISGLEAVVEGAAEGGLDWVATEVSYALPPAAHVNPSRRCPPAGQLLFI